MTTSAARRLAHKESEAYAKRMLIIRDLFAGQALQGLLSCDDPGQLVQSPTKDTAETYADAAYVYADAMLKRRKRA